MEGSLMKGRQLILGLILILAGGGMIFDRMGFFEFGSLISVWWPMIIVAAGAVQLYRRSVSYAWGAVIILFGALMQLDRLDILNGHWIDFFWPLILIVIGVSILFPEGKRKNVFGNSTIETSEDYIEQFNIFSGSDIRFTSKNLKGGSVTAIFGGSNIDLTESDLASDGATIDATAIFGGIDIIVPEDWKVEATGVPIFGGWGNKTKNKNLDIPGPILKIRCVAVFGGIDVKNYK
jgi:predicted membrane protein